MSSNSRVIGRHQYQMCLERALAESRQTKLDKREEELKRSGRHDSGKFEARSYLMLATQEPVNRCSAVGGCGCVFWMCGLLNR
jgi:hypothetical protein